MLSSIAICALMCSIIHVSHSEPVNQTIFTRVIETHLPNPVSLVMGSDLFTISKSKHSLDVYSTSGINCKLTVDPFEAIVQGRINAIALEFDQKIVVWGIQKTQLVGAIRRTYYTLIIVDPQVCNYKVVPLPVEEVPSSWPVILPQIVAEKANFLVFYPTQRECNPCAFWSWGERIKKWRNYPSFNGGVPSSQFWVKSYGSLDYYNLFYAFNSNNDTALLRVLDMLYYRDDTVALLDTTVDAVSVSYGTFQNTAICSITAGKYRREVECARMTSQLEIGHSWNLPLKNYLPVSDVSIEVDKLGNTFIGVIDSQDVRFFIYNVDVQLIAELDFGLIDAKYTYREVNVVRFGNETCLVAVGHSDYDAQDTQHVIKCVQVSIKA